MTKKLKVGVEHDLFNLLLLPSNTWLYLKKRCHLHYCILRKDVIFIIDIRKQLKYKKSVMCQISR